MVMATVEGVKIVGIVSAIPERQSVVSDIASIFGEETAQKISDATGVRSRHIVDETICTSDLCVPAAKQLLEELDWSPETVSLIIFVSQTPDYVLPATAASIHGRLGLSKNCSAFDINLGCSGFVYGLWTIAQLMGSGMFNRTLLLVGDTSSHLVSDQDRSAIPLFGDAAAVVALEKDNIVDPMHFDLGTDGNGVEHLIVPAGGCRTPYSEVTSQKIEDKNGNIRSQNNLYMNGTEIFTFTLREVPPMLRRVLEIAEWTLDDVDSFVFHQANLFILNYLIKRMKLDNTKVPTSIEDFGNTSSASIPLTMSYKLSERLTNDTSKLVLAGFGVGFSWAAVTLTCLPLSVCKLIYV